MHPNLVGAFNDAVVLVGVDGTAGVLARYGLTVWVQSIWTVAGINLVGSFLLGLLLHVEVQLSHEAAMRSASASWAASRPSRR